MCVVADECVVVAYSVRMCFEQVDLAFNSSLGFVAPATFVEVFRASSECFPSPSLPQCECPLGCSVDLNARLGRLGPHLW